MIREAKAGPYVMVFRDGDMAKLFHVGENEQRELVGWGDYFPAVVQFAGEVIRQQAVLETMKSDRTEHDLALRGAISETARTADEARRMTRDLGPHVTGEPGMRLGRANHGTVARLLPLQFLQGRFHDPHRHRV